MNEHLISHVNRNLGLRQHEKLAAFKEDSVFLPVTVVNV